VTGTPLVLCAVTTNHDLNIKVCIFVNKRGTLRRLFHRTVANTINEFYVVLAGILMIFLETVSILSIFNKLSDIGCKETTIWKAFEKEFGE
jgi:hypothetical protein